MFLNVNPLQIPKQGDNQSVISYAILVWAQRGSWSEPRDYAAPRECIGSLNFSMIIDAEGVHFTYVSFLCVKPTHQVCPLH